jgi:hypothetical protein
MNFILENIMKCMLGLNLFGFLYRLKINLPKIYIYINYTILIKIILTTIILFVIYFIVEMTNNISFIKKELVDIHKTLEEINEKEH